LATFLASVSVAFLSLEAGFWHGIRGEAKRVQISAMVEPHTLELIDQERGERSRGQYLDWLVRRRRRRQSVSYLGGGTTATQSRYPPPLAVLTWRVLPYMQSQSDLAPSIIISVAKSPQGGVYLRAFGRLI